MFEQADVPAAATLPLSRAAAEDVDRHDAPVGRQADAPREEQVDRLRLAELERRRVLEEERPLLREEQIEAREVDLLLVGLDLREVGVDRDVEREVRTNAPLHVDADVGRRCRADRRSRACSPCWPSRARTGISLMSRRGGRFEPGQLRGQRDAVDVEAARDRREIDLLVLVADVAHDVEAPGLVRRRSRSAAS